MKKARLHNGIELAFPDKTPDSVMDSAVEQFMGIKKNDKPRSDGVMSLLVTLFGKFDTRFDEIKNSIMSIPKPPTPEKINLKILENSMEGSQDNLGKIVKTLAPMEKSAANIGQQIESLLHVVAENNPSNSIDSLKEEIFVIAKSLEKSFNSAIRDSQERFRSQLLTMFENQTAALKKIMDSNTTKSEKNSHENTVAIVRALTAEKEIVFDRKTDRPIGVKIKAE